MRFQRPDAVLNLPGAHQFVQITGRQLFVIFPHRFQHAHNDFQILAGGLVEGGRSGTVFMGGLHHPVHHAVGLNVVGIDVIGRGVSAMIQIGTNRFVNDINQFLGALGECRGKVGMIFGVTNLLFGNHASFGVRAGRKLMAGAAHTVTGGKQAVDRGHAVVNLAVVGLDLVCIRYPIQIRAGGPETAAAGVRSEQIGLGGHDLGIFLFRLGVGGAPQVGLPASHIQEVFPGFGLKVLEFLLVHGLAEFGQGAHCIHHNGSATFFHLKEHQMVPQTGRCDGRGSVRRIFFQLGLGGITAGKILTQTVKGFGFEQQEPGAHRTITVFKTGRGEAVFHHGQLGTDFHAQGIGGTGVPDRIPGTAFALTDAAGLVYIDGSTAGYQHGLALDDEHFVFTDGETDRTGNLVFVVGIQQQFDDENPFENIFFANGKFGSFGNDPFVRFAVDHDLPFARAYG